MKVIIYRGGTTIPKRFMNMFLCAAGLVFIVAGILIGAYKVSKLSRLKDFGIPTKATISDIKIVDNIDSPIYSSFVNFTADNGEYIIQANLHFYHSGMHVGDTIDIYYNPDNPLDIMAEREPLWLLPLVFVILGLIPLSFGVRFIPNIIRVNKNIQNDKISNE